MDIKYISPRYLLLRFVASLTVLLALSNTDIGFRTLEIRQIFIFTLLEIAFFAILMMLFYMIMVQYLLDKEKIALMQALGYRLGAYLVSGLSFWLTSFIYKQKIIWILWLIMEIGAKLTQWLFAPKQRRNQHGR